MTERCRRTEFVGFVLLTLALLVGAGLVWFSLGQQRDPVNGPPLRHTFSDDTWIEFTAVGFVSAVESVPSFTWSPYGVPTTQTPAPNAEKLACSLNFKPGITSHQFAIETTPASSARMNDTLENRISVWYDRPSSNLGDSQPKLTVRFSPKVTHEQIELSPGESISIGGVSWKLVAPDSKSLFGGDTVSLRRRDDVADRLAVREFQTLEIRFKDGETKKVPPAGNTQSSVSWRIDSQEMSQIVSWSVLRTPYTEAVEFSDFSTRGGTAAEPKMITK